jgi:type III secretion protein Q
MWHRRPWIAASSSRTSATGWIFNLGWRSKAFAVIAGYLFQPDGRGRAVGNSLFDPDSKRGSVRERSMDKPTGAIGILSLSDIEADDLPVRVLCEIGRFDLSLGELRRIEVGATLPLVRGADNAVDIMVSGKRIGRGALIKIGSNVGVRVTRLFDPG